MNALLYIIKLLYIMHLPDLEEKGFYMRVRAMERERGSHLAQLMGAPTGSISVCKH